MWYLRAVALMLSLVLSASLMISSRCCGMNKEAPNFFTLILSGAAPSLTGAGEGMGTSRISLFRI
jgi:hypothetical protein